MSRPGPRAAWLLAVAGLSTGCYSIGYETDPSAVSELIAVPLLRNETLRRGLEHDLTRDLRREILETTPLHLAEVGPEVAVLRGTIERVEEQVLVAGPAEEVLYASLQVTVRFGVYRGQRLVIGEDRDGDGEPDAELRLSGLAERDASRGEDRLEASREVLRDLAEMMALELQGRRDDRHEPNDEVGQAAPLAAGQQVALIQREADWFRVELPPRRRLRVTLYHSADLRLRLCDARGEPLAAAEGRDEGRIQDLVGGLEARAVFLEVSGGGAGARYQLALELLPDDAAEPNQSPAQATPLAPGRTARALARDEDWWVVEQPAGQALLVRLEVRGGTPPRLVACDGEALPLPSDQTSQVEAGEAPGGATLLRVEPPAAARRVWLRVAGGGEQPLPYELRLAE